MQPYRNAARAEAMEPTKPLYGLICAPKLPPPHTCFPPCSPLLFCWMWITGRAIRSGSLWRCHCGSVFMLSGNNWCRQLQDVWVQAGGILEINLLHEHIDEN